MSNKYGKNIMKIIKAFESSCLLITGVTKTFESKANNKEVDFLVCY